MIEVRPARVEDAEAVVRVHEDASADAFEELVGRRFADVFPRDERLDTCRRRLSELRTSEGILVAELDGVVVGMDEASRCDRLVLLREGRILAEDTPDGLRARTGATDMDDAFLRLVEEGRP